MLKSIVPLLICLVACLQVDAQFTYVFDQTIPVSDQNGKALTLPWTGGINAAQVNTMDINADGKLI